MHVVTEPLTMNDLALMSPEEEYDTLLDGVTMQPSLMSSTEVQGWNETEPMDLIEPNVESCAGNSTMHGINGLLLDDMELPESAAPRAIDLDGDDASGPAGDDVSLRGGDVLERGGGEDGESGDEGDVWLGMNTATIAGIFSAAAVGLLMMGAACMFFVFGGKHRRAQQTGGAAATAGQGGGTAAQGAPGAAAGAAGGVGAAAGAGVTAEQMSRGAPGANALQSVGVWEDDDVETVHSAPLPASQQEDPLSPGAAQPWLPAPPPEDAQQQQAAQRSWVQLLFGRKEAANAPQQPQPQPQQSSQGPQSGEGASGEGSPGPRLPLPPSPSQNGSALGGPGGGPVVMNTNSPVSSSEQRSRGAPGLGVLSESTETFQERMRSANASSGSPGTGSAPGMCSKSPVTCFLVL